MTDADLICLFEDNRETARKMGLKLAVGYGLHGPTFLLGGKSVGPDLCDAVDAIEAERESRRPCVEAAHRPSAGHETLDFSDWPDAAMDVARGAVEHGAPDGWAAVMYRKVGPSLIAQVAAGAAAAGAAGAEVTIATKAETADAIQMVEDGAAGERPVVAVPAGEDPPAWVDEDLDCAWFMELANAKTPPEATP